MRREVTSLLCNPGCRGVNDMYPTKDAIKRAATMPAIAGQFGEHEREISTLLHLATSGRIAPRASAARKVLGGLVNECYKAA